MKLTVKQLTTALRDVGRVVKGRTTLPILGMVKLSRTDDDRLQLECTNLDAWIVRRIEFSGLSLNPVLVSHRKFLELVERVTSESCVLSIDGGKLVVVADGSRLALQAAKAETFPQDSWRTNAKPIAVVGFDLATGIKATAWAAEQNALLSGVTPNMVLALSEQSLICFASDNKCAAYFNRALICGNAKLFVPADYAPLLVPELEPANTQFCSNGKWISVENHSGATAVKLAEQGAMELQPVMEKSRALESTDLPRENLLRACHYAITLGSEKHTPFVRLVRKDDDVTISTTGEHGEFTETIPCPGPALNIKASARYVSQALAHTDLEKVKIIDKDNAMILSMGDLMVAIAKLVN